VAGDLQALLRVLVALQALLRVLVALRLEPPLGDQPAASRRLAGGYRPRSSAAGAAVRRSLAAAAGSA